MIFTIFKTTDEFNKQAIEINSLEELLAHVESKGAMIIGLAMDNKTWELEIYNDYRE